MKDKGFTIVESLVAIAVLLLAIAGTGAAVQSGLSSYIFSKDQIIAFYLAQEGFEQIRNMRDENRLNNRNWLTGFAANSADPCYFDRSCIIDAVGSVPQSPNNCVGACPVLRQDAVSGFYGYNAAWAATPFRRTITLSSVNANEVAVTVTVDWSKGTANRQFKLRDNLLNW